MSLDYLNHATLFRDYGYQKMLASLQKIGAHHLPQALPSASLLEPLYERGLDLLLFVDTLNRDVIIRRVKSCADRLADIKKYSLGQSIKRPEPPYWLAFGYDLLKFDPDQGYQAEDFMTCSEYFLHAALHGFINLRLPKAGRLLDTCSHTVFPQAHANQALFEQSVLSANAISGSYKVEHSLVTSLTNAFLRPISILPV